MALAINEEFHPWVGNISPDGVWRVAGPWSGTGNNQLDPSRVSFSETYPGETSTGFMSLTIAPGSNPLRGAELQSLDGYGYGTYEVRMKPSDVSGGVASFFLIGAPNYSEPEFDIEFLLNTKNQVTFTNHPGSGTTYYNLSFDPTAAFHTYGIIWTPNADGTATVADTIDGVIVRSETSVNYVLPPNGEFIMMNAWSGNANFGGGPPTQNSTTVYDWVHFTPWDGAPPPPPPIAGSISINDVSISEGNSGTKLETFTVTRSGGTAAFDVNFATSNGTATVADSDYVAASNTLHFGANQNTQTISVTINGDTKAEADETFNVNLANPTNGATISDGQGLGTIVNDDVALPPPTIIVGTSGSDVLVGTAGNDTIRGLAGNDRIDGAGGADTLSGGKGHDVFVFHAGEANGDVISDFHNRGPSSDQLEFYGFGQGTFTQIDATHWAIGYENNSHAPEVIQVQGTGVDPSDYHFMV